MLMDNGRMLVLIAQDEGDGGIVEGMALWRHGFDERIVRHSGAKGKVLYASGARIVGDDSSDSLAFTSLNDPVG